MRLALVHPAGPPPAAHPLRGPSARLPGARFGLEALERMPSLPLLTVAALLGRTGRFGRIDRHDGNLAPLPGIEELARAGAVLFTGFTCRFDEARALSAALRGRGVLTVAGGVHASHADESPHFDSVVRGEFEPLAETFSRDLAEGRLAPVYGPAPIPAGPLLSPVPDFRGLPADAVLPLQLSRGCPFDCSFCIATKQGGHAFRPRPLPDVAALLSAALASGHRSLFLVDDNLFLDRGWANDALALLAGAGARFLAHSDLRIALDTELLARLRDAGCHAVLAGIETVGQASLEEASAFKARMGLTAEEAVRRIQDAGIGVIGSFVAGFDHDDPSVFDRIGDFAERTNLLEICVKALTPFPGTALHARLAAEGRLLGSPVSAHDARHVVFRPARMSETELSEGIERTLARFADPARAAARIRAMKAAVKGRAGNAQGFHPCTPPGPTAPDPYSLRPLSPQKRGEGAREIGVRGSMTPDGGSGAEPPALRVLLVHPRAGGGDASPLLARLRAANESRLRTNIYRTPPLALAELASRLPEGAEARLIDEASGDPLPDLAGFDLMLVTASTCQAGRAGELAGLARAAGVRACVGGVHATVRPRDFAGSFDTVFAGEAEETFPEFLADLAAGRAKPRYDAPRGAPLGAGRLPRYDLFPRDRYDFLPLQAGRGCPRGCAYCASTALFGAGLRRKTAARLRAEAEAIAAAHPGAPVYVVDDNLFADPALAGDAMDALEAAGLRFLAYGDPSLVERPDLPAALARAGCMRLLVGFDSLDPAALAAHAPGKARFLPRYAELVDMYQSAGVGVFGGFMAGFDGDDESTFDRIGDFVETTGISECCVSVLTPLPGARENDRLESEGRIVDPGLSRRDGLHLVFRHPALTPEAMERGIASVLDRHLAPAAVRRRTAAMKRAMGKNIAQGFHPCTPSGPTAPDPCILSPVPSAHAEETGAGKRGLGVDDPRRGSGGGAPAGVSP